MRKTSQGQYNLQLYNCILISVSVQMISNEDNRF